ncbi:inositol 2-dehydrogenase [Kordiimonas lacus]|uniref:Myo-inositol 2-dehydrogenase / D-chiro-inositol 1-dehydrogenase n=1 Tax=Kordiimonas lacus TaxID=637679 RepID=A0A1G7D6G6_9PROT|nr:inositol 2-dehydrogenase [Kordiimonas lacus]SDE46536.1 myo-inositol 2-dehydrogenase / D-chiro-inositol 1-dehydrogenase [Kordiimonas lacus]
MTEGICLIGAGRIGQIHAANFAALGSGILKYIVDPVTEAAAALAADTGAQATDLETALADQEVTGVVIASATNTHADLIEKAAHAGKAIFCEKPIDLDLQRTTDCLSTADSLGTPLLLGFNRRFDPNFAALKASLDAGAVGTVEMVHITSRDPSPPPVSYIKTSGGLFKDMMIHDLDMARWLLGEDPVEVSAMASCLTDPEIATAGDVDSALVTLRTASGKLCQISNSRRAVYGYDQRIEVHGSGGLAQVGNQHDSTLSINRGTGLQGDKIQHFFLERYAEAYKHEARHFQDILKGSATPLATGADGLKALILAEAALKSLQTGTTVQL